MTDYKLNRFTTADAQALAGKTADITAWDDDELETKATYPGAKVTGIIDRIGPYLVIDTAGALITGARTGEQLGIRPPEPDLHLLFTPGSAPATRAPSPATTRNSASFPTVARLSIALSWNFASRTCP